MYGRLNCAHVHGTRHWLRFAALSLIIVLLAGRSSRAGDRDVLSEVTRPHYRFGGLIGERVSQNAQHWVIPAPQQNPGLLEMFARRDQGGPPDLMPWAGEFVGKYLISGVQALRMVDDPQLPQTLADVVRQLLALQADDGYLGPWPATSGCAGTGICGVIITLCWPC